MDVQTTVREIRLTSFGRRELEGFLAAHGLGLDADTEYALGVYDEEENLVACGCAAGRVLKQFAVAGGVASNSHLRAALEEACKRQGVRFYRPSPVYCTDNAAMIGVAGYYEFVKGVRHGWDLNAVPNLRLGDKI